jgi:drug/metabolite transporter (DMT)-like permease
MLRRVSVRSRRGAYVALAVLTAIWGSNWIVMKLALERADPVTFNIERTWVAVAVLFAVLVGQGRLRVPPSWGAVVVTGFFQTTVNFGSTTMALAGGGAGRTSVLVHDAYLCLAGKRHRLRAAGLVLASSRGPGKAISRQLWRCCRLGWPPNDCHEVFQRRADFDMLNLMAWQMLVGVLPLTVLPLFIALPGATWDVSYAMLLLWTGAVSTAAGFLLWIAVLRHLSAGTASLNMFAIPVIALVSSMAIFGDGSRERVAGIALIGAGLAVVSVRAWTATRRGEASVVAAPPLEGG